MRTLIPMIVAALALAGCGNMPSPQRMGGGQSSEAGRDFRSIECQVWCDGDNRLYYAICMAYADFDPNLPLSPLHFEFRYHDHHGELLIDGHELAPSQCGKLLALNPFGQWIEVSVCALRKEPWQKGNPRRCGRR